MTTNVDPLRGFPIKMVSSRDGFTNSLRLAEEAVDRAIGIENSLARGTGGHRHYGPCHPVLLLPLPRGWRKSA